MLGNMVVVLAVALLVVSKIIWKLCCGSKNVPSKNISGSGNTKKNNCGSNSSDSDVTW